MANKDVLFKAFNASSKEREPAVAEDGVYSASECDKRPQFFHSDESIFWTSGFTNISNTQKQPLPKVSKEL